MQFLFHYSVKWLFNALQARNIFNSQVRNRKSQPDSINMAHDPELGHSFLPHLTYMGIFLYYINFSMDADEREYTLHTVA